MTRTLQPFPAKRRRGHHSLPADLRQRVTKATLEERCGIVDASRRGALPWRAGECFDMRSTFWTRNPSRPSQVRPHTSLSLSLPLSELRAGPFLTVS